jgi:hypothetical protein
MVSSQWHEYRLTSYDLPADEVGQSIDLSMKLKVCIFIEGDYGKRGPRLKALKKISDELEVIVKVT